MSMGDLDRYLGPLRNRVRSMVGRAVITAVDDNRQAQTLQLEGMDDEGHDDVERFQDYGFTSHPLSGAEAVTLAVGGTRSHQIVAGIEDRRYRPRGLEPGEVALYDDQGQLVILRRDGVEIHTDFKVTIVAGGEVKVEAPSVVVESDSVDLGGEGGPAIARVGDHVEGGVIVEGSDKVRSA